jgi:hypothetical protein
MNSRQSIYTAPRVSATREVPASVKSYLNGEDLLEKQQAVRLSTVNADGWGNAAVLSAGEVLVLPDGRVRFAMYPQSNTAANLVRDGRVSLSLAVDGGICELRARARKFGDGTAAVPMALFEAEVEEVRQHSASYAQVTGGITFSLDDPAAAQIRWQQQIAALRARTDDGDSQR